MLASFFCLSAVAGLCDMFLLAKACEAWGSKYAVQYSTVQYSSTAQKSTAPSVSSFKLFLLQFFYSSARKTVRFGKMKKYEAVTAAGRVSMLYGTTVQPWFSVSSPKVKSYEKAITAGFGS